MKYLLFILIPFTTSAQFVKVASMQVNGTKDEYRILSRPDSAKLFKKDIVFIHDTIYFSDRPKPAPITYPGMFIRNFDSGQTRGGIENYTIKRTTVSVYYQNKKSKRWYKKTIPVVDKSKFTAEGGTPCKPDTIKGMLIYNNRATYGSNIVDSGYWIGCDYPHFIWLTRESFIPGKWLYPIKGKVSAFNNGVFKNQRWQTIPNYRVYGLMISNSHR